MAEFEGQGGGVYRRRCCEAVDGTQRGRGQGALIEPLVLAGLARCEAHGYDLVHVIREMTGGEVVPDPAGIYRVLRRLEAEGVVSSEWQEGDAGPQRRSYRLTEEGSALLEHWVGHLQERRRSIDVLIAAVQQSLDGR